MQATTSRSIGAASGREAGIVPYMIAEYLGRKRFATLYGLSWTAYAIGGATGWMLMSHSFDTAGTYVLVVVPMFSAPCFVAALMQPLLPFRVRPSRPTDGSALASDSASTSVF